MTTIFMNLENGKTSSRRSLVLNVTGKIDLRRRDARIALLNISIITHGQI